MTCGRFVAANTITPELPPKPSSSVSSWLMVGALVVARHVPGGGVR